MKKKEVSQLNLKELVEPNLSEQNFLTIDPVDGDCSCARGRNAGTRNGSSTIDEDLIF
ncbi:hypothetical protein ACSBL2_09285 [Pedobacter sp. AW31-3R]|uniref:hypothetical protein n=1 Tax=Pedobacter sp. AW31-3R TaxID=3445781 RepID=UPI003FA02FD5